MTTTNTTIKMHAIMRAGSMITSFLDLPSFGFTISNYFLAVQEIDKNCNRSQEASKTHDSLLK